MNTFVDYIVRHTGLTANVVRVLGGLTLLLVIGSAVRLILLAREGTPQELRRKRLGSLGVWWVLFALLVLIALLGEVAAVIFFALVSLLGLREFRMLAREHIAPVRVWWRLTYLSVPIHYLLIYLGWLDAVHTFIPVWVLGTLLVRLVFEGRTSSFLETAGITFLGLMLIVFLFSHAVLLLTLPDSINPDGGAFGLFLFLVVLTEGNDIAQALWGRLLGRRRITPTISPNKTWEGFLLGATTTMILAALLANPLTPFSLLAALAAGLLIAVSGFLGDVTMSAVKREVGVKDSGDLLPGQGGVLDRIDSLTFTGPLFYYFTSLLCVRGTP